MIVEAYELHANYHVIKQVYCRMRRHPRFCSSGGWEFGQLKPKPANCANSFKRPDKSGDAPNVNDIDVYGRYSRSLEGM
jgi:hypothetical protein